MLTMQRQRGMSLVEAMIALVIAAILVATAMPMYSTWVQNTQIRTGAEAILNGLQLARSEALNRNANVQFEMTGAADTGWRVSLAADGTVIQTRSAGAGSASAMATVTPAGTAFVTFNALGRRLATNADGTVPIDRIDIASSIASFTGGRNLRVTISAGGQVRMCDPDSSIPAGDTRRC